MRKHTQTNKWRKGIAILFAMALAVTTGLTYYPSTTYAGTTQKPEIKLSQETYYHLDLGVQTTYSGPQWQGVKLFNYGYNKSGIESTVAFPTNVQVLDAYPLNSPKGKTFDFDGPTSSTNIPTNLINKTESKKASDAYQQNYANYISTDMTAASDPTASGNKITFSYNALMKTNSELDAVMYGFNGYENDIWKLFGGKNNVSDPNVRKAIQDAFDQAEKGTVGQNKMCLVFCPTVIKYKKIIDVAATTDGAITTTGSGIDQKTDNLVDPGDITTPEAEPSTKVCVAKPDRGYTGSCINSASKPYHISGDRCLKALGQSHEYDSKFQYWKVTVKLSEYDKNGKAIVTTIKNNMPQRENGNADKFTVTFPRVGTYKVYGSKWWYYEYQRTHTHKIHTATGTKTHCTFKQYAGGAAIEQHGAVGPYTVVITPQEVNKPISFDPSWHQTTVDTDTFLIE